MSDNTYTKISMAEAAMLLDEDFQRFVIEKVGEIFKSDRPMYQSKKDFYNRPLTQQPFAVLREMRGQYVSKH